MRTTVYTRARIFAGLLAVAGLVAVPAGAATAAPRGIPIIPVTTEQEQVTTGSNTDAKGLFSYVITGNRFCYLLRARNLSAPAVAAHVHIAPRDVAGPVLIPLEVGSGRTWQVATCTTVSSDILRGIKADPEAYYVNVHTPTFPGGEIRGQLK